jgi:hypothetical protein
MVNPGHCLLSCFHFSVAPSLRLSILNELYLTFPTFLFVVVEVLCLCLVLAEEVVAVLALGVEVAILAVMVGLSWTTGFVLFSVRKAVFVDISVQAWGMVQVGAEVWDFDSILCWLVL